MENFIPYSSFSGQTGSELTNAKSTFLSITLFFLSTAFWTAACGDAEEKNRTGKYKNSNLF